MRIIILAVLVLLLLLSAKIWLTAFGAYFQLRPIGTFVSIVAFVALVCSYGGQMATNQRTL